MNKLLFLVGTSAAIATFFLARHQQRAASSLVPVDDLAHRLQDAWVDHHTVV